MQLEIIWSALTATVAGWPTAVKLGLCLVGVAVLIARRSREVTRR
jgi:hypothetical protein